MSVPKIIHYCWFGPKEIPEMEQKCIASWKKVLPDYKIMFWNEQNFDVNSVPYVREAYEKGKYAFVSDYVRMYALYNYGGVYFDTDVEVLKPLDKFLEDKAFIGFENRTMIGTGIIGAEKHSALFEEMLNYYSNHNFVDDNGNIDTTTNHPFYVIGKGWVAAGDLAVGDEVFNLDGTTSTILGSEIEVLDEPILVYNLEVEDFHSYFVGCVPVLVHNYKPQNQNRMQNEGV